ncbi:ABC transporter ATP-binding protein [Corynebacterium sp. LK2510]|uniref:ABC transporter ATP-binding protein n=1 Tax=Corynebacterium sp. LK2510 TaxID=3110472 RepID=UPI0034CEEBCB
MINVDKLAVGNRSKRILDEVSLRVRPGDRCALLGSSGTGKSTLSLALLGEVSDGLTVRGNVTVLGQPVIVDGVPVAAKQLRQVRRRIGRLDQSPSAALNPAHRISKLVTELAPGSKDVVSRRMVEALELFGLPTDKEFLDRYCGELSGGQRRRVALACTLLRQPELLILDEPTAGLDVRARDATLELVRKLVSSLDSTLLVITHDPEVAHGLANNYFEIRNKSITQIRLPAPKPEPPFVSSVEPDAPSLLHVSNLTAAAPSLRTPPIRQLSFAVYQGEAIAITGPSGCGKSTVAKTLVGLWPRRAGTIELDGTMLPPSIRDWPRQLRGAIGWVPQDSSTSVNPVLRLGTSMRRAAARNACLKEDSETKSNESCQRLGLPKDWEERYPKQLSGGQLQRFSIARAIVAGARVLVLDEVTSSLDTETRDEICELLNEIKRTIPLIVITHDPHVVSRVCDREIVLSSATGAAIEA